ncbi:methyltransferase domain-containing protein [Ditylenchus destructor]|nr:methyltransferase domain-containing protein [Ditylenchus destructor]
MASLNWNELNRLPTDFAQFSDCPLSLKSFFSECQAVSILSEPREIFQDDNTIKKINGFKMPEMRRIKAKKRHELEKFGELVLTECRQKQITRIVDVGCGLGHMLSFLNDRCSNEAGTSIELVGVETSEELCCGARNLYGSNHIRRVHIAPDDPQTCEVLSVKGQRTAIISLHGCGDLQPTLLSEFVKLHEKEPDNVPLLIMVGCCYHKLSKIDHDNWTMSYAVKKALKDKLFRLPTSAFRLACQERLSRWKNTSPIEHQAHVQYFMNRTILECIDRKYQKRNINRNLGTSIEEIQNTLLQRHNITDPNEQNEWKSVFQEIRAEYAQIATYVEPFTALQFCMQTPLESLILGDRILYLHENGISADLQPTTTAYNGRMSNEIYQCPYVECENPHCGPTLNSVEVHLACQHYGHCQPFECELCCKANKQARFFTELDVKDHIRKAHPDSSETGFYYRVWVTEEYEEKRAKIKNLLIIAGQKHKNPVNSAVEPETENSNLLHRRKISQQNNECKRNRSIVDSYFDEESVSTQSSRLGIKLLDKITETTTAYNGRMSNEIYQCPYVGCENPHCGPTLNSVEVHLACQHYGHCQPFECEHCCKANKQARFFTELDVKDHIRKAHPDSSETGFYYRVWVTEEYEEKRAKIKNLLIIAGQKHKNPVNSAVEPETENSNLPHRRKILQQNNECKRNRSIVDSYFDEESVSTQSSRLGNLLHKARGRSKTVARIDNPTKPVRIKTIEASGKGQYNNICDNKQIAPTSDAVAPKQKHKRVNSCNIPRENKIFRAQSICNRSVDVQHNTQMARKRGFVNNTIPCSENQQTSNGVMSKKDKQIANSASIVEEVCEKGSLSRECRKAIFGTSRARQCESLCCKLCGDIVSARRDETLIKHAMQKHVLKSGQKFAFFTCQGCDYESDNFTTMPITKHVNNRHGGNLNFIFDNRAKYRNVLENKCIEIFSRYGAI